MNRVRALLFRAYRSLPTVVRVRLVRTFTPSFWVGAMCMVQRPDGSILLVRHSYRKGWGLPGGLLKRNEHPVDAAARETREEVGLDLDLDGTARVVVDAPSRRVDIIYSVKLGDDAAGEEAAPRSPEILEVRWFGLDSLPRLQKETKSALAELDRRQGRATSPS